MEEITNNKLPPFFFLIYDTFGGEETPDSVQCWCPLLHGIAKGFAAAIQKEPQYYLYDSGLSLISCQIWDLINKSPIGEKYEFFFFFFSLYHPSKGPNKQTATQRTIHSVSFRKCLLTFP